MSHTTLGYKNVDPLTCAFVTYYVELDQAAKELHYLAEVPYMNSKSLQFHAEVKVTVTILRPIVLDKQVLPNWAGTTLIIILVQL
jgi:hypothetical protein